MAEEAPKYSNSPDFSGLPHKSEFLARHSISPETRLGRFFQKFNHFFKRQTSPPSSFSSTESPLSGRIHQLQKDIVSLIDKLLVIREDLEQESDPQFPSLISTIIDPLMKEINRMQKARQMPGSAAQQVKDSKGYTEWIEKAKMWIDLCSKRHQQKEAIYKAVMEHTIQEFHARIDRDLQVVQDYLVHTMDRLNINDLVKNELKERLEPELSQHLFELYLLKDHPQDLSIDSLNLWRADADLAREGYFSAALHTIDLFVGEMNPPHVIEEISDTHSIEIHVNLMSLEEQIIKLEAEIRAFELIGSEDKKKMCMIQLANLEEEAHHINGDLRLTHEHIERVQQVLETLSAFREFLQ